jgi:GntR family transcriptional regulator / MocR family aminotransferase
VNRSNADAAQGSITGADFLQLSIGDAPPGGRSTWLAGRLRSAIADGRLPVGARLPATRVLAAELRVSRGVVTEAYQRLVEDGHVAGRGRAGTVVVAAPVSSLTPPVPAAGSPFAGAPGLDVFDTLRSAPARLDLSPGVPDLASFPRAAWLRAERAVLGSLSAADLGYGDPCGTRALRQAVADRLARNRGVRTSAESVVITAGVSQALGLLTQVLGVAEIAVEDPGSLGTRQHLRNWGVSTPPVPVDDQGLCVASLSSPAVLVTPAHQFPMGVVLSGSRRRELLDWAAAGGIVIEDDYDAEHRYDRAPVPALRSMHPAVCYAGSVSKLLAPALRLGWLVAPPEYLPAVVEAKRNADLGNGVLAQYVLAHLMESGALEQQLRFLRTRHRRRRDVMISAVHSVLPSAAVHGAAAGLHLTVTFPGRFSDVELAASALALGVKVQPLSWHRQESGPPGLVLGYAARTATEIAEAVSLVGQAFRHLG